MFVYLLILFVRSRFKCIENSSSFYCRRLYFQKDGTRQTEKKNGRHTISSIVCSCWYNFDNSWLYNDDLTLHLCMCVYVCVSNRQAIKRIFCVGYSFRHASHFSPITFHSIHIISTLVSVCRLPGRKILINRI